MAKKKRSSASNAHLLNRPAQIRCAIYTRVSVDEKSLGADGTFHGRKEENSLRTQEQHCRSFLSTRGNYAVAEVFTDDGFSAKSMKRPGLQRMFQAIERGEIDAVVVYKVDRLTRSVADFCEMSKSWVERDVQFISASQNFETASVGGRLMLNILLTFAQFEREMIAERTRDTYWSIVKDGRWPGGPVVFGFRLGEEGLEIDPEKIEIVVRIFNEAAAGRSAGEIAQALRRDGIKLPSIKHKNGRDWYAGAVRAVIENTRYRGVCVLGGHEFPTKHGAIVSRDLWDLANARLPENAPAARNLTKHDYAFVGVGRCGICGQPLAAYPGEGRNRTYEYYTCRRARKRLGGPSCKLGHIRVDHLEPLVIDALSVLGKHPDLIEATINAAASESSPEKRKSEERLHVVTARLDDIRSEVSRLEQLVMDKSRPTLAARMLDKMEDLLVEEKRLKDEKRVLELTATHQQQKAEDRELVAKSLANLGRVIGALPPAQRRELLQLLVSRLEVKPWQGEQTGIANGAIAIAPEIGSRRYSVKISLSESSLLSTKFTNSVDGSTFEKIGCPGWDRTISTIQLRGRLSVSPLWLNRNPG